MKTKDLIFTTQHASEILKLTCDTLILMDDKGVCLDMVVRTEDNPYINQSTSLVGRNLFEVLPPETSRELQPEFERVVRTGSLHNGNYDLPSSEKTYYFKAIIQRYEPGLIIMQYRDITQRSQMKRRLQDANLKLKETECAAKIGQWQYNAASQRISYSGYIGILMKEEEELDTFLPDYLRFIHQEDQAGLVAYLNDCQSTGKFFEYRIIKEKVYYVRVKTINTYLNNKGERIAEGYVQNVNDLIEKRNELEMVTLAVDNSSDTIYATKMDGSLIFANQLCRLHNKIPKECRISDYKAYELLGNIPDKATWDDFITALLHGQHFLRYTCNHPYPEFDTYVSDCTSYIIKNGQGEDIIWSFRRDITQQLRYEKQLKEAKEKAEESDRLKSAFLSNMSHEIRTPLNAIVGFSGIMAEIDKKEERKKYHEIIESNNNRLLLLINEVLDLSKIEAGVLEFSYTPVDLHLLCREVEAIHQLSGTKATLVYDTPTAIRSIQTDRNRLMQVLSNLIDNAIKFTPSGSIHFGYACDDNQVEFYVRDTGIGIAQEMLPRIFDRFIKIDSFALGTGLGLSICKTIIEKLGGSISAVSEPGQGSTFSFRLPAVWVREEGSEDRSHSFEHMKKNPQKNTILVAEDIEHNYGLVSAMIGNQYRLLHAKNGKEAVKMQQEYQPDMILMDIKMPEMDGLEAVRIIRESSPDFPPIIAVSAYAYEEDRKRAFQNGCNDFLSKPLNKERLLATIKKYLE